MPYPGSDDNEDLYSVPSRPTYMGVPLKPAEITARRIELEHIELLSGRPERQTVIGSEDVCNLLIALHKTESVEQFLERI